MDKFLLVLTTVPDEKSGEMLASQLVEKRLAACVTVSAAAQSHYWWKGSITHNREFMLFIKTSARLYAQIEKAILEVHPYEVPEIIALSLSRGHERYLNWISEETGTKYNA